MTRSPLWLAIPSRFAALPRVRARIVLGMLAALLLASLTVLGLPDPTADVGGAAGDRQTDVALYEGIVAAVTHGQD